ncbi:hypothetical protein [Paraburkholderia acidicola]|nr:hypothetical protein [Paraburkholderia acidicola]
MGLRTSRPFVAALLAMICATGAAPAIAGPSTRVGFWAGENPTLCVIPGSDPLSCPSQKQNFTPDLWKLLKKENGFLNLAVVYGADFGTVDGVTHRDDGLNLIKEANAQGVPINAWILLPLSENTFANKQNAQYEKAAVAALIKWETDNNLQINEIALDLEFPIGWKIFTDALHGKYPDINDLKTLNFNPKEQCAAVKTYAEAISYAHDNGVKIVGSPLPFVPADLDAGNMALQDMLNLGPVFQGGYDQLFIQAYRAQGPIDLGSGFVAAQYKSMQKYFGAAGQVTLGNAGKLQGGYSDVNNMVADVRMLAGLGATDIPIFDLDGSVDAYGLDGIQKIFDAAKNPMSDAELAKATQPSVLGSAALVAFKGLQGVAYNLTPYATALGGQVQVPNPYPDGCDAGKIDPLKTQ